MRAHSQLIGRRQLHFGFPSVGLSELYVDQACMMVERAGGNVLVDTEGMRGEAAPPSALARLKPDAANTAPFEPSPYKSVYLWFDRAVSEERFWSLLWHPDRLNYDFYELTGIRRRVSGGASLIASNVIHSHRIADWPDERIVEATLEELASAAPGVRAARLLHSDVHHVPMAIPCPYVGTEMHRPTTRTAEPGIFLAGDWTRTRLPCSMESAVRSGLLAGEACLTHLGQSAAIAIEPRPNDGLAGWIQRCELTRRASSNTSR